MLEPSLLRMGLNPYCLGGWSRSYLPVSVVLGQLSVLILIVLEDGLGDLLVLQGDRTLWLVLILIVLEDGLGVDSNGYNDIDSL